MQDCTYRDHCEARILEFGALELTSPSPTSRTEGLNNLLGSRSWKRLEWDLAPDCVSSCAASPGFPLSLPGGLCPSPPRPWRSLCMPFATPAHSLPQLKERAGPSSRVWTGRRELQLPSVLMVMGCLDSASPFLFLALRVRRDRGFIC